MDYIDLFDTTALAARWPHLTRREANDVMVSITEVEIERLHLNAAPTPPKPSARAERGELDVFLASFLRQP